jgi:hypothetical protein
MDEESGTTTRGGKDINEVSEKKNLLYSAPDPSRTWLLPMAAKEQECHSTVKLLY